jgi:cellulose 1,4-beta-cellobiosidase
MRLFKKFSGPRRIAALAGVGALVTAGVVAVPGIAYAAPGCTVVYQKAWEGGGGFGANVTITNTGDPITTGWTLAFAFPNAQRVTDGWPVTWSQAAGSNQVTAASNADWNRSLATGASFTAGFNGTINGATNTDPATFSLNGTACNGGGNGGNTPPTVSLTSPTNNQTFPANAQIPLAANASDNSGVARVEFLVDGAVVGTDTTSPYTFSAPAVAIGSHTAAARAVDNGNPALSTTSAAVPFVVQAVSTPSIVVNPPSLTLAGGASGSVNVRLSAFTSNVTVNITRTGSTALTCTPTSIAFTSANWQAGVNVNCTAAAGTAAATATFSAAGTGLTSATFTVSRGGGSGGTRVPNPYVGAGVYNNPNWRASAMAEAGGSRIANQPTGVWIDRIAAINGTGGALGVREHLNQALVQAGGQPFVIQFVIYNLPGRDCSALASNGELGPNDLPRYKTEYIDPIAAIFADPAYANLRIVAVIEIDSLPNLVTNTSGRPTAVPQCDTMLANRGYVDGVGYALAKLGAISNVYNYIDAGHHGWIGWDDNFGATANIMFQAANASGSTPANVHGFITNTANYSALTEQFVGPVTEQLRNTTWIDFNRYNEELAFAQAFRQRLIQAGFNGGGSDGIGMLIDTGRNGWGGPNRPTAPSTSTVLNTFVNESRIDRRIHKGNWCNQSGAGLGERPRAAPAAGIDAYVWIKPPGESDGSSSAIPNDEGKGFDRMCDPTYGGNARNGNSMSGALPNSPLSGHWFSAQFQELMRNAFPPL